ncbi:battenin CLN3 protein [Lambiella insularis]|nr:battenin CLN3 protein [Lambiella insularis]
MLPLPGAPSTSWTVYKARFNSVFAGANPRVCLAFWLFGLINNVLYVVILSAALDLVGPSVPKGVVLLADVIPSFLTKLVAPYFIHLIPYPARILCFAFLSSTGMLLIALTPSYTDGGTIATKMAGVVLASLSSGGGELSFVGLTHYYGEFSLAAWGSGTGAAGLVGAGAYALATTVMGLSVRTSLLASAVLPAGMVVAFFAVLPKGMMKGRGSQRRVVSATRRQINEDEAGNAEEDGGFDGEGVMSADGREDEGLLSMGKPVASMSRTPTPWMQSFRSNLRRARGLFFP